MDTKARSATFLFTQVLEAVQHVEKHVTKVSAPSLALLRATRGYILPPLCVKGLRCWRRRRARQQRLAAGRQERLGSQVWGHPVPAPPPFRLSTGAFSGPFP